MPKAVEITAAKLRLRTNLEGTKFLTLYEKLMRGDDLDSAELIEVLKFAIVFLRSEDPLVSRFGYRLLLQYSAVTRDYEPLHAIAKTKELMPIVVATERLNPELGERENFASTLFAAHQTNFLTTDDHGVTSSRTRGQMELRSFNQYVDDAVIVAPTSYGKSEMLVEKIAEDLQRAACIIVPTRALIAQTRASLVDNSRIRNSRVRVFTHPDAYVGDTNFVAVLTQERLQRLFAVHPDFALDMLLVDEAHNLLPDEARSRELSQVILTARSRNENLTVSYYTPFIAVPGSLLHVTQSSDELRGKSVNEHVKAEKLIYAPLGERLRLYDQFLNRSIELSQETATDELAAVRALAGPRTLIYVNRPSDAQDMAKRLAEGVSIPPTPQSLAAIRAIADLIDPSYSLIDAIRAGVLFHHGKVPDVLRQYIERLFREDESPDTRFLVTTSTLLEGVNTPADTLVIMSPSKGRGYLTRASFRNLIGRVARFREVFDPSRTDLDLLQPKVYLIRSRYARENWDVEAFLSRVADLSKSVADDVANPLLAASEPSEARDEALEYLENVEPGSSGLVAPRRAQTDIGALCFRNGVHDFDIFENEAELQRRVDALSELPVVDQVSDVVATIRRLFFDGIELDSDDLTRLRDNAGAQRFYSLFLGWRADNEPFKLMIAHFLRYWSQLDDELVYVGSAWGEESYGAGWAKLYVRMRDKSRVEQINLAVAKVKEEQDFVDFNLMRYVEILNSLRFLDDTIYNRIKYGTADPYLICLLKNGFSPELSRLVRDTYSSQVAVDITASTVEVYPGLPTEMIENDENEILVYEAETMINVELDAPESN